MELTLAGLFALVPGLARAFPGLPLDRPPWALAADVVVANHRNESPGTTVAIHWRGASVDTGERKFGALLGVGSAVGANSVLSPGTILRPGTVVPRLTLVSQTSP